MFARPILACGLFAALLFTGCHSSPAPTSSATPSSPHDAAIAANKAFLGQKTYDPWILTNADENGSLPCYIGQGGAGYLVGATGEAKRAFVAGRYENGQIRAVMPANSVATSPGEKTYPQTLDLRQGKLRTQITSNGVVDAVYNAPAAHNVRSNWPHIWQTSDVIIDGDPQAQQVTHANLFYLLSSTFPGSTYSIPPMGLSSNVYGGHIFWDADVWMLPALIVQHPEYAKPIVDYRFKLLTQAKRNAQAHGCQGAEYPWESADTGKEEAPTEFAQERHITADVAFAAWQYYLWTGDKKYLKTEGWPLLQATAQYWVSRVAKGADGKYHIKGVLSPDETAGVVDDDAYTNSVVKYNLLAAQAAARMIGQAADPQWTRTADTLFLPVDQRRGIIAENSQPLTERFSAKQADALLLLHPLGFATDAGTAGKMLDFYTAHTMKAGPAMTSSIEAIVAARLGRPQQSLDLFRDSYQPFMRAPWDAFSEKRTTNNVYFLTGMAGCVQSVLYGFAGLQAVSPWQGGVGRKITEDGGIALYCDPHLPPGWGGLTVKGVRFHGKMFDLTITPGNQVAVHAVTVAP